MAVKPLMTWDPKYARWYKRYRKVRYLISCRELKVPPTKAESVAAANEWWLVKKREVDGQRATPVPWAIKELQMQYDWYEYTGDPYAKTAAQRLIEAQREYARTGTIPEHITLDLKMQLSNTTHSAQQWNERERILERSRQGTAGDRIKDQVKDFLAGKEAEVHAGEIKPATLESLRHCLKPFEDLMGGKSLSHVTEATLKAYRGQQLDQIAKKKISRKTGASRMNALKQFIKDRWRLRRMEMPRNFDELGIAVGHKEPKPYDLAQVKNILAAAPPHSRLRLYALLCLNCGMTQIDIASLKQSEIRDGRIVRKRTKEEDEADTPTIEYKLWGETWELLRTHRSKDKVLALLSQRGTPLYQETINDGKVIKTDCIRLAWRRFRQKKFEGQDGVTLKKLRKTGATLLSDNKEYHACRYLYLGHAPSSIADKHYTPPPQKTFDEAVEWLGKQLGVR
jgi:integrase